MQAVSLTIGVFAMMLFLFATRIIKVTEKLRMGIVAATGAVFLVYLFNMILSLFGADLPFLHDAASSGSASAWRSSPWPPSTCSSTSTSWSGAWRPARPRKIEWYAAFGLVVTIVWLYLELLRLLGRLQGRD